MAETAGGRISVSVPEVRVGDAAVTTLALVVHELATNSIKYGALSAASGRLDVSCPAHRADAEVVLTWTEQGGPPVASPAVPGGAGQLGGSAALGWRAAGLVATLRMSRTCLAA